MITLIKEKTNCNITAGQNGLVWIRGEKIEDELLTKKAINFISENAHLSGLTEKVSKWFEDNKK
jgi:exosome complex RNA-binding protein Rrp4